MVDYVVWGHADSSYRMYKNKKSSRTPDKFLISELDLDDMKDHFTCGYCYHLAIHLNQLTGLDVYNVGDNHAVVGNGKMFLDITGWHSLDSLKKIWKSTMYVNKIWRVDDPTNEFQGWGDWIGEGEELSPRRMRQIALKVLDKYGSTPSMTGEEYV